VQGNSNGSKSGARERKFHSMTCMFGRQEAGERENLKLFTLLWTNRLVRLSDAGITQSSNSIAGLETLGPTRPVLRVSHKRVGPIFEIRPGRELQEICTDHVNVLTGRRGTGFASLRLCRYIYLGSRPLRWQVQEVRRLSNIFCVQGDGDGGMIIELGRHLDRNNSAGHLAHRARNLTPEGSASKNKSDSTLGTAMATMRML